ncbi:MAG: NAD(P)/FAD-dependent oxidoreductase [Ruminococcaceae bacterium]|nr:NAD(P)/FAD-dependent oxidoreductase [Oscillospiraceae bacterium]
MSFDRTKVCVIGGGAAGLMCAGKAAELGCDVTLYEKKSAVGRKLAITGKGRCNVTNNCDRNTFIENVPTNPRFLYAAYSNFTSEDTMAFFENMGVELKTERGNRVFPVSDRSFDIVDALRDFCKKNGVKIVYEAVDDLVVEDGCIKGVIVAGKTVLYDKVAVCTGGKSYPQTGSDGDGFLFAERLGINIIEPKPSLVPLETEEIWPRSLMGLSLKNVRVSVFDKIKQKEIYSDFGEMLFTHFGLSGPTILSASCHMKPMQKGRYSVRIDLKPALDEKTLDSRLLGDFEKYKNKNYGNSLGELLPQKLIPVFVDLTKIPEDKKVNNITRAERQTILKTLKCLECTVRGFRPIEEAIITSGGVDVKEIDPKTMMCKKIENLYFAGELIDVDAYTGGFNLQIAFSTANLAAIDIAR